VTQSLRGLLVDDGVHDGVGGAAEPDAVVDERGDVASVSALDELDVVEDAAAQFGNPGAGARCRAFSPAASSVSTWPRAWPIISVCSS